jgi:hypothetical protein
VDENNIINLDKIELKNEKEKKYLLNFFSEIRE